MAKKSAKTTKAESGTISKSEVKELRAELKRVRAGQKAAESKANKWKAKAKAATSAATKADARVAKLEKKLAKAKNSSLTSRPRCSAVPDPQTGTACRRCFRLARGRTCRHHRVRGGDDAAVAQQGRNKTARGQGRCGEPVGEGPDILAS